MLLKSSSFSTIRKSSVSTGFTEQIMPILRILCYNGSLVTWTVVLTPTELRWLLYPLCTDHKQNTQIIVILLLLAYLLGSPRDRYPANPLARWLLPSNDLGANHIENTTPVLLVACLFESIYLATGFSGSIASCSGQIRHNIRILLLLSIIFISLKSDNFSEFEVSWWLTWQQPVPTWPTIFPVPSYMFNAHPKGQNFEIQICIDLKEQHG
jgi:hypothetical protein